MKIFIKGGLALLFDGRTFRLEQKDILTEENRIAQIADPGLIRLFESGGEITVIDAAGKLVMPGLITRILMLI